MLKRSIVFVALAALAVTGCGSTNTKTVVVPTTSAATPVPTRAGFIAQADEICKTAQAELAPIKARVEALSGQSQPSSSTYKALAQALRENVAVARTVEKSSMPSHSHPPTPQQSKRC